MQVPGKDVQPLTQNILDNNRLHKIALKVNNILILMNWIPLTNEEQLLDIVEKSRTVTQVIFKHSTRCRTSSLVLNRLERSTITSELDFHFLDLLTYRKLSNKIAEEFDVYHESPQVLVIKNGQCVYDENHMSILMEELNEQALIKQG